MLSREVVKAVIHHVDLTRQQQLLLLLAADSDLPKRPKAIRELGVSVGIPEITRWNITRDLAGAQRSAIKLPDGWQLTSVGKSEVNQIAGVGVDARVEAVERTLRDHVEKLQSAEAKGFLLEAVGCLEARFLRAAVVLSWVGAIAVLQDEVLNKHLDDFNMEARRVDSKWRAAKTRDDLSRMKESEFLNTLARMSLLGKNVKNELINMCLDLRNGCGHPNNFVVRENRVAAHLEVLIDHVFAPYA